MPRPKRNEAAESFIGRFMGSGEAQKSFPSQKQRLAVAYAELKARKKKRSKR
jgi:hypothetical protein